VSLLDVPAVFVSQANARRRNAGHGETTAPARKRAPVARDCSADAVALPFSRRFELGGRIVEG
jgi:hypothetical protein